jgi:hypothetical protein
VVALSFHHDEPYPHQFLVSFARSVLTEPEIEEIVNWQKKV